MIQLHEISTAAAATPSVAAKKTLFLDSADGRPKLKDSAGVVTKLDGDDFTSPTGTGLASVTAGAVDAVAKPIGAAAATDILDRQSGDARFAPITHTHVITDTTGLQTSLDAMVETIFSTCFIAYTDFAYAGLPLGINTTLMSLGTIAQVNVSGHSGASSFTLNATASNASGIGTSRVSGITGLNDIQFGVGKALFGCSLQTSATLSTVGNPYTLLLGYVNSSLTTTAGVYFRYDQTQSVWQAVCKSASVETVVNTDITVVVSTIYKLRIEINSDGTQALFYIDGVLKATTTTNIPTGTGNRVHGLVSIVRLSTGTTDSSFTMMRAYWIVKDL